MSDIERLKSLHARLPNCGPFIPSQKGGPFSPAWTGGSDFYSGAEWVGRAANRELAETICELLNAIPYLVDAARGRELVLAMFRKEDVAMDLAYWAEEGAGDE